MHRLPTLRLILLDILQIGDSSVFLPGGHRVLLAKLHAVFGELFGLGGQLVCLVVMMGDVDRLLHLGLLLLLLQILQDGVNQSD